MSDADDIRKEQRTVILGDEPKVCPECGKTFPLDATLCPDDDTPLILPAAEEETAPPPEEDPLIGELLRDKWRVLSRLGAGSFGTVYKVKDEKGGWIEALKVLAVDRLTGADAEQTRKRFLREAQIMKRLSKDSPHIVGLSTYEEDIESGLVYFAMEYVEGRSLGDVLAEEGPMSMDRTIEIALQVCDALAVAHQGQDPVVHRDLKLENVMLTTDRSGREVAKVLDFGIAKIAEREADSRLTTVGTLGTPGFAAPEQLRAEEVDGRTDLFAFGVILYSLLTGKDPWLGHGAAEGTKQIYELMVASDRGEPIPIPEHGVPVPAAMQSVVMRLLRRDPAERFQTADELREALERVSEGGGAADAASLRVLTAEPGVRVAIRSGRKTVAEGETPLSANGVEAGSYRIAVVDPRFEPVETTARLEPGAISDVTVVTTPRKEGVGAYLARHRGAIVVGLLVVLVGGAALYLRPWGVEWTVDELATGAAEVEGLRLAESGIIGRIPRDPLPPTPVTVPVDREEMAEVIGRLREAGVSVELSWLMDSLRDSARIAQSSARYFGDPGRDVRSFAERMAALSPDSDEARSLLLKVAERMAWDAEALADDGDVVRARTLLEECREVVPGHERCTAVAEEL